MTVKSQIEAMTGAVATINPQGETARFMLGDIKGKDAATAFRLSIIRVAVLEVLKGNPRNLKEAIELAAQMGKGKKARAYVAGFAPLMDVAALERTGKWMDGANADIRTQADTLADAYTAQFASAHAAVMAEKAAPKAKKAAAVEPAAPAADASDTGADDSADSELSVIAPDVMVASAVTTVVTMLQQGMLSDSQVDDIRAALAVCTVDSVELAHLMGRTPALLREQAH